MYSYFTLESQTNFKTKNRVPHFLNRLTDLPYEAKVLYSLLLEKMEENKWHNNKKTGSIVKHKYGSFNVTDGDNVYVEAARSTLARIMGKAIGTVRKYIRLLAQHGLLVDVRSGLTQMNKIFLRFPVDAEYVYDKAKNKRNEMIEFLEQENEQEKSEEEAATSTPHEPSKDDTNIHVRSIIAQLTDECLADRDCKNLLKRCKGNTIDEKLEDLQKAVESCYGLKPKYSYIRMVFNTLDRRFHDQQPKESNIEDKPDTNIKSNYKPKNGFQCGIYSHGWDLNDLEQKAHNYTQSETESLDFESMSERAKALLKRSQD